MIAFRPLQFVRATGALSLVLVRAVWLAPRMDRRELLRSISHFGFGSLPLAFIAAGVIGATVVLQTGLYVQRFGARTALGWAAGYAVLWEFGPLLLGLMMVARVGARNAAELAQLSVGGQLQGLEGLSLDPLPLLIAPRVWGVVLSILLLCVPVFFLAIFWELVAAYLSLDLPLRVFLGSFSGKLGWGELWGGVTKSAAFALAISLVSTLAGVRARGGAKAVGEAAARAVVHGAAAVFLLDFALSSLLARLGGPGGG